MNRNDQIFFVSLGSFSAIGILTWAVATYGTSATAPEWAEGILTGFAIIAAVIIPLWTDQRRHETRERIAEVIVASALRSWLRIAAEDVNANLQYLGTGGEDGEQKVDMPEFKVSSEQIAEMRPHIARDFLNVMERRERRQNYIYGARYYAMSTDEDEAYEVIMEYFEQIAHLFWSARRIYQEIARDRDLEEATNRPSELQDIHTAESRAEEYRQKQEAARASDLL